MSELTPRVTGPELTQNEDNPSNQNVLLVTTPEDNKERELQYTSMMDIIRYFGDNGLASYAATGDFYKIDKYDNNNLSNSNYLYLRPVNGSFAGSYGEGTGIDETNRVIADYVDGMRVRFRAVAINTGIPTDGNTVRLRIYCPSTDSWLSETIIYKNCGLNKLSYKDLVPNNIYELTYDKSNNKFILTQTFDGQLLASYASLGTYYISTYESNTRVITLNINKSEYGLESASTGGENYLHTLFTYYEGMKIRFYAGFDSSGSTKIKINNAITGVTLSEIPLIKVVNSVNSELVKGDIIHGNMYEAVYRNGNFYLELLVNYGLLASYAANGDFYTASIDSSNLRWNLSPVLNHYGVENTVTDKYIEGQKIRFIAPEVIWKGSGEFLQLSIPKVTGSPNGYKNCYKLDGIPLYSNDILKDNIYEFSYIQSLNNNNGGWLLSNSMDLDVLSSYIKLGDFYTAASSNNTIVLTPVTLDNDLDATSGVTLNSSKNRSQYELRSGAKVRFIADSTLTKDASVLIQFKNYDGTIINSTGYMVYDESGSYSLLGQNIRAGNIYEFTLSGTKYLLSGGVDHKLLSMYAHQGNFYASVWTNTSTLTLSQVSPYDNNNLKVSYPEKFNSKIPLGTTLKFYNGSQTNVLTTIILDGVSYSVKKFNTKMAKTNLLAVDTYPGVYEVIFDGTDLVLANYVSSISLAQTSNKVSTLSIHSVTANTIILSSYIDLDGCVDVGMKFRFLINNDQKNSLGNTRAKLTIKLSGVTNFSSVSNNVNFYKNLNTSEVINSNNPSYSVTSYDIFANVRYEIVVVSPGEFRLIEPIESADLASYSANGNFYQSSVDSSNGNIIVLSASSGTMDKLNKLPSKLVDGMKIRFRSPISSNGTSTVYVRIPGIGDFPIKKRTT